MRKIIPEEYRFPNNNLFVLILMAFVFFLLVELVIRVWNLYHLVPIVDVPSHFFAGIAFGLLGLWLACLTGMKRKRVKAVIFMFFIALIWEVLESFEEYFVQNPDYLIDRFWWDGFWDIIVGVVGAIVAMLLVTYLKKKTYLFNTLEIGGKK